MRFTIFSVLLFIFALPINLAFAAESVNQTTSAPTSQSPVPATNTETSQSASQSTSGDSSSFIKKLVPCEGPECQACDVVKLADNIIGFLIQIGILIGVVIFAIAGFTMATSAGNASQVSKAKGMFTNVIVGFIILLAAWLIVDTVMKTFAKGNQSFGTWNEIQCTQQPVGTTPTAPTGTGGVGVGGSTNTSGKYSDAEARAALANANISVWESRPGATSLEGINQNVLNEVVRIKNECNCDVVVTGGTESGVHADGTYSHGNGYKIDIDDTAQVNSFITSNNTPNGTRSDGAQMWKSSNGCSVYAKESNHWDILTTC
ncbi:hypothetical protein GW943_00105 [Candidatus Parcubacteria bacterium]|uniref:Uncharacterized protein n=1 Tax=Candidatus Kaiserbacteria bacterium CG10_big_fil_rev_8_21_14_0_10_47_16 TaxID=1974608 RepID=A0A2H0UCV6_9BACT|nr:hypothetical protein [Candidatus Parcubacteria bacterium]PIR84253.1 MAG: hypothetical protein COU16_01480 [Candidatus Kaiserbacteria bacterium CG10_big_fil_rev_8_21_14_0_10_47_16]